ncbi:MAG TPA: RnfABCDGE type electron transport complex subunit D [Spirochaetales bacterium]|nr:RnfABCDGE type electron transport complex subunit D [Spirochaetales bacterium]
MADKPRLLLSSSPSIYSGMNVQRLMLYVIISLLPVSGYGIYLYGIPALTTILVSVVSCVGFEVLFRKLIKAPQNYKDLSAVVTGILLALILPPSTPWWMTVLGALASIVFAKEFFGGLGYNPFNPALIGRAVLLMSFPAAITTWHKPFQALVDATTTATPLNILKLGGSLSDVAQSLGVTTPTDVYTTLFWGTRAGCIGESSIPLILLGALFLLITGTIGIATPLSMIATTVIFSFLLGMDPLFQVLSGGVVFGAVFMATDYVSTPLTPKGKVLFGIGAGIITLLIRRFGGFPEGVTYGILIMNACTPYLNNLVTKKYGYISGRSEK